MLSRHLLVVFERGNVRAIPFGVRVRKLLQEAHFSLRGAVSISPSRIPPWEMSVPSLDASLSANVKSEVSETEFRLSALDHTSVYEYYANFHANGSKGE